MKRKKRKDEGRRGDQIIDIQEEVKNISWFSGKLYFKSQHEWK